MSGEEDEVVPELETALLLQQNKELRPVNQPGSGGWRSASFIIGVEMAERFAYSGISANLMIYLTGPLGQSTAIAAENVNVWAGTSALLPLAGAFITDSFLGRFRTIILASLIYILALGLMTLSAVLVSPRPMECQNASNSMACSPPKIQIIVFFFSLYLAAVAQGMHKPCVQAFGADQFNEKNPLEARDKSSFFNWWYLSICASITVTIPLMTYIQDNLSWGLGFGIPCLVMVIALLLFLLGSTTYRFRVVLDQSNPFSRIICVAFAAVKNRRVTPSQGSQRFRFLNKALEGPDDSDGGKVCSLREVEETKDVLRLFPILATCLVYGIAYSQPATLYTKQGMTMDRSIGGFIVPAASLQSLITLTIVVFVVIYDRIVVPIARCITSKPSGITMLQRVGTGLFLSFFTMIVAALVERKRLETARKYGLVDKPNEVVPLSAAWLVPQYILSGVADSLTMIGLQEFFYDQAPEELKSTGLALYLSIFGVGGFLSSLLISVIEKATGGDGRDSWFCDNLNKARLDYFYYLLAGLTALAFTAFLYVSKSYMYQHGSKEAGEEESVAQNL